jgi:uncharacterized membrane protein YebE (DUF533 family)
MFDAKNLLDLLVKGAGQSQGAQGAGGGLADILGGLLQGAGGAPAGRGQAAAPGGGLEDILRQLAPGSGQGAGGLGDILGNLQTQIQKAGPGSGSAGGGLMDILGQVLGQATAGVKDGAQRIDQSTGASTHVRDAVGKATGKAPDDILKQIQDLIANNQMGTGAILGSLGTILLGTRSGRSATSTAAKIGTIAMIGGLAWQAYQNHLKGKPLLGGSSSSGLLAEPAPSGSGFEPEAVDQRHAVGYIRAMIAAAASDGRLDAGEYDKLLGNLKAAGIDAAAEEFLAGELNSPATVEDLAASVSTPEEALQLYTAARLAIEVDTAAEQSFLAELAAALGLDPDLVSQVDAAARAA